MKTVNGMSFGFSAVNAGQRNVAVEPQLIAVSTEGNFRMTPPVSRALGLSSGDYVTFLHNIDEINAAIDTKAEAYTSFCEANGLEVGSPESVIAIHKEFDMWAVAKGFVVYDSKGNAKTTTERLTKHDKLRFISQHFEEMLASALENAPEEIKDALSREGVTKEEQMDILSSFVKPREMPKYKGSKTANPAGLTGTGTSLTFTDANVWKQLKADMGDEATKMNRVYTINLDEIQNIPVDNGHEVITVKAYLLKEFVDKAPARVGSKEEGESEVEE